MHRLVTQRLNNWYVEGGWTYATLSEATDLSPSTLHTYHHNPPMSSLLKRKGAMNRLLEAYGHTWEELLEGIPMSELNAAQQVETLTEENARLNTLLDKERDLQQKLADELTSTREQFARESKKNDMLLEAYKTQAEAAQEELDRVSTHNDREHNRSMVLGVLLFIVFGLMIVFFMYSFYAFLAFDIKDPTKGIWPFPWMR